MIERIIIAGFGGQGVLTAGLLLAEAAVNQGLEATFIPAYGAEMRGGTANCNVIIADKMIANPIVYHPNILIALNSPSFHKFLPRVKEEGLIIANSGQFEEHPDVGNRTFVEADLDSMASDTIGDKRAANMIALGLLLKQKPIVERKYIEASLRTKFAGKGAKLVDLNIRALEAGLKA